MPNEVLDPRTMLPVTSVVWGPFPLRRGRLVGGLGIAAMGLVMLVVGLQKQIVTCARSGALADQCAWQTGVLASKERRFPLASLHEVRVLHTQTSSKGRTSHWGQLVLVSDKRELTLPRQTAVIADANAATLQAFLDDPAQQQVRIDTGIIWPILAFGGLFALMGLWMLHSVWFGRRRFHLTWDGITHQLSLQPYSALGMTAGEPTTFNLREPSEVEIQWEEVKDFFTSSRSPGPRGGRLQVRLGSGALVELLPYPMPGYSVHLRAAEALRNLLRCPPASAAEVARRTESAETERPKLAPGWAGIGGKFAATWIGACCGSLLGLGISSILAVMFGFVKLSDSAGGPWFFGGMLGGAAAGVALAWRLFLRPDER